MSTVCLLLFIIFSYLLITHFSEGRKDWTAFLLEIPYYKKIWGISWSSLHHLSFLILLDSQFDGLTKFINQPHLGMNDWRWFSKHFDETVGLTQTFMSTFSINSIVQLVLSGETIVIALYQVLDVLIDRDNYTNKNYLYSSIFFLITDAILFLLWVNYYKIGCISDTVRDITFSSSSHW